VSDNTNLSYTSNTPPLSCTNEEAVANVIIAGVALFIFGFQKGLPLRMFGPAGTSQVLAKACTSLALANGLSFPVVTLAKSGKMAPVMVGSIFLGGTKYSLREYLTVAAIITGTVVVSMDSKKAKGKQEDSLWGLLFIVLSLTFDGVVGGMQNRLKKATKEAIGRDCKPYDMMFWTNLVMAAVSIFIAFLPFKLDATMAATKPEFYSSLAYVQANPEILQKVLLFSVASAAGQSFIFYTIANFDSLTCTTVTTTRKVLSTLLSIFTQGHQLSSVGWSGVCLASAGISMEVLNKVGSKPKELKKQ